MINQLITSDGYKIETYKINEHLSYTIAYDFKNSELPANGGLRFSQYHSVKEQEIEALTLARHMSQKHEIYDTGFSGVKLVANGLVTEENKKLLLNHVAKMLNGFSGKIYTGCDLNISDADMNYLYTMTPYVLNGIGSQINTSTATAYGVLGALTAVMKKNENNSRKAKCLIHGVGKIGSIIAKKLIEDGHEVFTYDANVRNADIDGAKNISENSEWHKLACDYLILCSKSGIITSDNVDALHCRWIISSANSPFADESVIAKLKNKNIMWIPDVISNAGAVICDSFEMKQTKQYLTLPSHSVYDCVYRKILTKTLKLLHVSHQYNLSPGDVLKIFLCVCKNDDLLEAA